MLVVSIINDFVVQLFHPFHRKMWESPQSADRSLITNHVIEFNRMSQSQTRIAYRGDFTNAVIEHEPRILYTVGNDEWERQKRVGPLYVYFEKFYWLLVIKRVGSFLKTFLYLFTEGAVFWSNAQSRIEWQSVAWPNFRQIARDIQTTI